MTQSILFAVVMTFTVASFADDDLGWPRFRGPNGSGVAEGQQPPTEIGPETNVKWKVAVSDGLSSPIVVGDLLVITAFEDDHLYTIAYNRNDGSEAWRAEAPAEQIEPYYQMEGSPAASTSATDGQRIVSYFGSCGLFCYDLRGNELWKLEMPVATVAGNFGSGVSPIIADGKVILVRDMLSEAAIIAVNAETGDMVWETTRESPTSYCTPVVWNTGDGTQIVAAGHGRMVGYDTASGEEVWTVLGLPSGCCASPMIAEGVLYFAGWSPGGAEDPEFQMPAFDDLLGNLDADKNEKLSREEAAETFGGFFDSQDANQDGEVTREEYQMVLDFMAQGRNIGFALRSGGTGDVTESHILWQQTRGLPYVPSAIAYEGQLVMVKEGGIVTAYDATTGDQIYMDRAAESGGYYASPVAANGNIYLTQLDTGVVTVLRAGTAEPEVVVQNPPFDERVAATPAIADDTLYIRTEGHLYAFAEE